MEKLSRCTDISSLPVIDSSMNPEVRLQRLNLCTLNTAEQATEDSKNCMSAFILSHVGMHIMHSAVLLYRVCPSVYLSHGVISKQMHTLS